MADVSGSSASQVVRMSRFPEIILLFSGKRKSGKDYITDILFKTLDSDDIAMIKISGPIKRHWAKTRRLDFNKLLTDGEYKENHRREMIKWGEDIRNKDPGYFCRAAIDMYNAKGKRIWIVSDVRRKTDLKWFRENFPQKCKSIRIKCPDHIRSQRGWIFTKGVDDCETECDLDDVEGWNLTIVNAGESPEGIIELLLSLIRTELERLESDAARYGGYSLH
ncbi:phosphomevalonate kinase [Diachasma alloeum]|uniref:phosphomevalonate kinase n=1 Tax=Diachasma alloeum TaxID=454923 RepID=UPI0007382621|nr:phosphomevalonate kinase [Diachasma alloeum]